MAAPRPTYAPPAAGAAWESVAPQAAGFDAARVREAVAFAQGAESPWPATFYHPDGRYVGIVEWNETGPWSDVGGHVRARGGPAGLILKGGRIVAEWGDTGRADMTFSVAKSYLAVLAGVAMDRGLITSLDEPVGKTVAGPWFQGPHNGAITWRHLLHQSSEWQGELWGKSDQVDHNRQVGAGGDNSRKGQARKLQPPGSFYEYNDVRVNVLALALLMRFGRPLPDVLREAIMNSIGASAEWEWHGYRNSFIDVAGRRVQSVSGGAHWGGGMFISACDQARLGLLVANRGRWGGTQVLPASWIDTMLAPSPTNESYGCLWWLNRGAARHASAPASSVFAMGAGNNIIWIEPDNDIVCVMRWIDKTKVDGFLGRVMAAVQA